MYEAALDTVRIHLCTKYALYASLMALYSDVELKVSVKSSMVVGHVGLHEYRQHWKIEFH